MGRYVTVENEFSEKNIVIECVGVNLYLQHKCSVNLKLLNTVCNAIQGI